MKRVVSIIDCALNNEVKYKLRNEYESWGIYEHLCPNGLTVHQDWLLVPNDLKENKQSKMVRIGSYNDISYDEILDAIDNWKITEFLGFKIIINNKTIDRDYVTVHPSGRERI